MALQHTKFNTVNYVSVISRHTISIQCTRIWYCKMHYNLRFEILVIIVFCIAEKFLFFTKFVRDFYPVCEQYTETIFLSQRNMIY
jgi:hypothetical protein